MLGVLLAVFEQCDGGKGLYGKRHRHLHDTHPNRKLDVDTRQHLLKPGLRQPKRPIIPRTGESNAAEPIQYESQYEQAGVLAPY